MARGRRPKPPSVLRRGKPKKKPRRVIWVFCEGKKTEPAYLRWFARTEGHPAVRVESVKGCGVPKTIVEKARNKKQELAREARRSRNSFDNAFEVWAMYDVDEHPNLVEARVQARDNDIGLAVSNPCVELWALLHLDDQTAHIERHDCQNRLHDLMPKYHHDRFPEFDTDLLEGHYEQARTRAKHLAARRTEADDEDGNPSTSIWKLTDSIKKDG